MLVDGLDDDAEELVEQLDDLGRPAGWTASSVEPVMSMNRIATLRASPAEALLPLQRLAGDVLADVAAEHVADPLALAQAGDHLVEAALQQPELAAVVDGDLDVEIALARRRRPRGARR